MQDYFETKRLYKVDPGNKSLRQRFYSLAMRGDSLKNEVLNIFKEKKDEELLIAKWNEKGYLEIATLCYFDEEPIWGYTWKSNTTNNGKGYSIKLYICDDSGEASVWKVHLKHIFSISQSITELLDNLDNNKNYYIIQEWTKENFLDKMLLPFHIKGTGPVIYSNFDEKNKEILTKPKEPEVIRI